MDQNRLKTVLSFSNRHGDWISRRSEGCCSCGRYSYFGVFFGIMTRLERRLRTIFFVHSVHSCLLVFSLR